MAKGKQVARGGGALGDSRTILPCVSGLINLALSALFAHDAASVMGSGE